MLELTAWFAAADFPSKPWLILGKGPTFERHADVDFADYNTLALNHVVSRVKVDVAHIIDIDVVATCAESLAENCQWLVLPRYPHLHSTASTQCLEDWFDEHPVLRAMDEQGRLVWYNLSGGRPERGSPVIGAKNFSSEAAFNILARMGVSTIRSLGIDGGRSYSPTFRHLESSTLLANGAAAFDQQFDRLKLIVAEHGMDYRPLVEPLRIFLGTDESQVVAHRVLEYSIRKSTSVPVEVVPMLNLAHRTPRDRANRPRTAFSFYRFMIPELCGFRGRALYLDADMLVFGDIAELWDIPFGKEKVLCTKPPPTSAWEGHNPTYLGDRSLAVMLLDCDRLPWRVDDIIAGLDDGRHSYEELMSALCVLDPEEIGDRIPPDWNDLERYDPARTKLLHFTVVPTQPWKNDLNPLGEVWMSWYREAVEAGAVPPEEVEGLIAAGLVKPSLAAALKTAPSRRSVLTNASLDLATARQRIAMLESRLASMRQSWSWRIGDAMVRSLRRPRAIIRGRASSR
jgi:hypothetical protein